VWGVRHVGRTGEDVADIVHVPTGTTIDSFKHTGNAIKHVDNWLNDHKDIMHIGHDMDRRDRKSKEALMYTLADKGALKSLNRHKEAADREGSAERWGR